MYIEVNHLSKVYQLKETQNEDVQANRDIVRGLLPTSLTIAQGEMVAIVGHNGAGKSTFLKMLANWLVADSGNASIDSVKLSDRMALVRRIGFVPETPNLFEYFSVDYNFKLFAKLFKLPNSRVDEICREFHLEPFRSKKVLTLSKGLRQRVSLGRALLANPPILLLDEPTSGLDFETTKEVYQNLKSFHHSGKTILFTSHRSEEIRALATRVIVLHGGKLIFDGTPNEYFQSKALETILL